MQTQQIHVSGAREQAHEIRSELFAFPEVLDVFVTGRPDVLVVVYAGRPRPGEWLSALRAVGYRSPARNHARWPRYKPRPPSLLRNVVPWPDAGAADGNRTTSSIRNKQTPRRRQDAA